MAEYQRCNFPKCTNQSVCCTYGVKSRRIDERWYYCADHIEAFLAAYYEMPRIGNGARRIVHDGCEFDIEMFVLDYRPESASRISLREAGGSRRLDFGIGYYEAAALWWQLEEFDHLRPLTHPAMAAIISALGGSLECAFVDKYAPSNEVSYEAKLYIRQDTCLRIVDVRPSDAVVLAIVCDATIVVGPDVLKQI